MEIVREIGIDVSKSHLDVSVDGTRPSRIANTAAACENLALELPRPCRVHLEASGGYERTARRTLAKAGIEVCVHDALKVRRMIQARAGKAKTDPIDARNVARLAPQVPTQESKSLKHEALTDLSRGIDQLKRTAAHYVVRAGAAQLEPLVRQAYLQIARTLRLKAKGLEQQFVKRVQASELAAAYKLALSVPGVGPVLARVAVCEMPQQMEDFTTAQVASYAGLAPIDDSSGKRTGARIGRGNSHLKGACYMPAVSALRHQKWARDLYARLLAKGRHHQQAIVAVMRRLLVRIAAVLKRGSPWKDEPQRA
jgi:transposase